MEETHLKKKCQYCEKEYKNVGSHEQFCKLNPQITKPKDPDETIEKDIPKTQPADPKEPAPLIITDVREVSSYVDDDIAWYENENKERTSKIPRFIGTHDNIPCALIMSVYGQLIPVYLTPGFIGMFPENHDFPEPEQVQEQPYEELTAEVITPLIEPKSSPQEEDKSKRIIAVPEKAAPEPKKRSLLSGIFGKKEKKEIETATSVEVKDMLRKIANSGEAN